MSDKKKDSVWKLEVHQLDVGQGDSALILFKKWSDESEKHEVEKSILIDGGKGFNQEYLQKYLSQDKTLGAGGTLDAVIITHFDQDHSQGIKCLMDDDESDIISSEKTKIIIQSRGEKGWIFDENDWKMDGDSQNLFLAYNYINKSIWSIFGDSPKPDGAPDIEIIAADKSMAGDVVVSEENLAAEADENSRSIVSLIKMNQFRFYTSGDYEDSRNLMEVLKMREAFNPAIQYFPIQALTIPHHGSKNNIAGAKSSSPEFMLNIMKPRVASISHGAVKFGQDEHPNQEVIDLLDKSGIESVYLTNPTKKKLSDKFTIAGAEEEGVTTSANKGKTVRGTIKFQSYSRNTESGPVKFVAKYRRSQAKVRDYHKSISYEVRAREVADNIVDNAGTFESIGDGKQFNCSISDDALNYFFDEDNKIKHLNPKTLSNFMKEGFRKDIENPYKLKVVIKEGQINMKITNGDQELLRKEYSWTIDPETNTISDNMRARRIEYGSKESRSFVDRVAAPAEAVAYKGH